MFDLTAPSLNGTPPKPATAPAFLASPFNAELSPCENGGPPPLPSGGVPTPKLSGLVALPDAVESGENERAPRAAPVLAPASLSADEVGTEMGELQPEEGWSIGEGPSLGESGEVMSWSRAREAVEGDEVRARAASSRTGGTATSIAS